MLLSEEQVSLAAAVREWLAGRTDLGAARAAREGATALFTAEDLRAAAELGLLGLLRGSDGGTWADLAVVAEELGRAGSPLPVGQAAAACRLLDDTGLGGDVVERVAEGSALCVLASAEPDEHPVVGEVADDGGLVLGGRARAVVGAAAADWLLVVATVEKIGTAVALVERDHPALACRPRVSLDLSRDIAAVDLHAARVDELRWAELGADAAGWIEAARAMLTAIDAVGAAGRLLAMTVAYVKERSQFGRLVGSFQAVKHACATMALDVEAARLCAHDAALALDSGDAVTFQSAAAVAGSIVGEACSRTASTALQLHGGMGFTWEHDLHLFLRRTKVDELLAGSPRHHRERLLDAHLVTSVI